MTVQPYLFFDGKCEEALEFYKKALDANVEMMMRFKENPEPPQPGDENCAGAVPTMDMAEKIMHASFKVGDALVMASDGMCQGKPAFQGVSLALTVKTEAEADKRFAALAEGGQVQMPLGKTFFSPKFGVVADKFGVSWMVIVD
jgi:PhnB protein